MNPEPKASSTSRSQPFWAGTPARTVRRGHYWIAGERVEHEGKTFQRGPMFVEWETPEMVTHPYPVVLVHGGGFQGTEWFDTPDGRPGWAQRLVEAGRGAHEMAVRSRRCGGDGPVHRRLRPPAGGPGRVPRHGRRPAGAAAGFAELLHLPDHRVTGNGRGLIYERNSDAALRPVLLWLDQHAEQVQPGDAAMNNTKESE